MIGAKGILMILNLLGTIRAYLGATAALGGLLGGGFVEAPIHPMIPIAKLLLGHNV